MIVKGSTVFKAAFKDQNLSPEDKYNKHISEIASSMDAVAEKLKATLIFMPHCIGPGDNLDDRVCARHVYEKMERKDQVVLLEDQLRVPELKGILGTFDMVVSERTHGGINAATMKVPTLWITHPKDHRTYGIVTSTLKLPQCLYNIENLDSASLTEKILDTYENRDEIVEVLKENIPLAQDLTMSNGVYFKKHVIDGVK